MKSSIVSNENLQHYLFIYLFIHTGKHVLRLPLAHAGMWWEAKPVLFSRAMHFEMLISK